MATERLMVAATVRPLEVGAVMESMPPHMTVFPWFSMETNDWPRFDAAMHAVIEETRQPLVEGGDAVFFGENEDIPVRRLNRATARFNIISGFDIHAGVYRAVHEMGDSYDDTYAGLGWCPHITSAPEFSLAESEQIEFNNLTVFKKNIGHKAVKAVYKWSEV